MKHFSRRHRTLSALAVLPLAIVCTAALVHGGQAVSSAQAASAPAGSATKAAITITNYSFHPATLTVSRGSTVVWTNGDGDVHTIKSMEGPEAFSSPALDSGNEYGFTFHRAGTYRYVCSVHPYMHGVIVVR